MNGSEFLIVAEGDDACATFLCEQLAADGYPLDRVRSADHAMSAWRGSGPPPARWPIPASCTPAATARSCRWALVLRPETAKT